MNPTSFVAVFQLIWHTGIKQGLIYRWTEHSILPMSTGGMEQGLIILNLIIYQKNCFVFLPYIMIVGICQKIVMFEHLNDQLLLNYSSVFLTRPQDFDENYQLI